MSAVLLLYGVHWRLRLGYYLGTGWLALRLAKLAIAAGDASRWLIDTVEPYNNCLLHFHFDTETGKHWPRVKPAASMDELRREWDEEEKRHDRPAP